MRAASVATFADTRVFPLTAILAQNKVMSLRITTPLSAAGRMIIME